MRSVLVCLLMICLGFIIPWTNGFYTIFSWILSFSGVIYLCLFIVDRLYIGDKEGFRMDPENPERFPSYSDPAPPANPALLYSSTPIEKENFSPVAAVAAMPPAEEITPALEEEDDSEPFVPFEIDIDPPPPPKQ